MYTGLATHLFAPWMDLTRRLQDRQMKGELMSPQAAGQVYEEWRTAWEDSFGRILRAPVMGYYRESVEKLSHAINSYTEFNIVLAEFYASIEGAAMQALETMQQKLADLEVEKGPDALSFRDIYSLWWQTNEQVYEELVRTDEFGRLLGKLVDRGMQFRADFQTYIEEVTKELPFPNRSEMNHLYKAVYQMKHEIRRMSKELAELKGQQGEKEPVRPGKTQRLKGVN
jgi:class III poly(R)-hydroxyalkanoic acid synthase PhaE subunit